MRTSKKTADNKDCSDVNRSLGSAAFNPSRNVASRSREWCHPAKMSSMYLIQKRGL